MKPEKARVLTKLPKRMAFQRTRLRSIYKYFGGVPDVVLTDNIKTVVLRHEAGKIIFLPAFESFCADMGFLPKTCQVRRPQTKGKVERLVRFRWIRQLRWPSLWDKLALQWQRRTSTSLPWARPNLCGQRTCC